MIKCRIRRSSPPPPKKKVSWEVHSTQYTMFHSYNVIYSQVFKKGIYVILVTWRNVCPRKQKLVNESEPLAQLAVNRSLLSINTYIKFNKFRTDLISDIKRVRKLIRPKLFGVRNFCRPKFFRPKFFKNIFKRKITSIFNLLIFLQDYSMFVCHCYLL